MIRYQNATGITSRCPHWSTRFNWSAFCISSVIPNPLFIFADNTLLCIWKPRQFDQFFFFFLFIISTYTKYIGASRLNFVIRQHNFPLVISAVGVRFTVRSPFGMSNNNKSALFACSKCFKRYPYEDLSSGQQLCKVC